MQHNTEAIFSPATVQPLRDLGMSSKPAQKLDATPPWQPQARHIQPVSQPCATRFAHARTEFNLWVGVADHAAMSTSEYLLVPDARSRARAVRSATSEYRLKALDELRSMR